MQPHEDWARYSGESAALVRHNRSSGTGAIASTAVQGWGTSISPCGHRALIFGEERFEGAKRGNRSTFRITLICNT